MTITRRPASAVKLALLLNRTGGFLERVDVSQPGDAAPVACPTEESEPEGSSRRMDNEAATDCGLYHPGHMPHPIQVFRALREVDDPAVECVFVEASDDGVVTLDAAGTIYRVWNHEPRRLSLLAAGGGVVRLSLAWNLLSVDHPRGSFVFGVDVDHLASGKVCEASQCC